MFNTSNKKLLEAVALFYGFMMIFMNNFLCILSYFNLKFDLYFLFWQQHFVKR